MAFDLELPYCFDLPTIPQPEKGKILVTGATGYIGGRLLRELKNRGYSIKVLIRSLSDKQRVEQKGVEIVVGDALNYKDLCNALSDVSVAYYLIHSLLMGRAYFEELEIKSAANFRKAAEEMKVNRIIYLGGLGEIGRKKKLSKHLKSRLLVADELSKGTVPVTTLRAAVIIGSGSASFEILKGLVKNAPVILTPRWARTKCQPISIRDVVKYLIGVLEIPETTGNIYDIGGGSQLTYVDMLKVFSGILNKKNIYINTFISNYKIYGYVASLLTPVPAPIVLALFEGGGNEVVCTNTDIRKFVRFEPLTYQEAIVNGLDREEQDSIRTRWSDAYPPAHELAIKLHEIETPNFISTYSLLTGKKASALFKSICKIGGKEGWFHSNWMWRTRGMIDRILLGVGTSRGRKSNVDIKVNDVIDFWRIEDIVEDERLLLRAEMKLPGKAWLEFRIDKVEKYNQINVTAYFQHKGMFGKIYWYFFVPFHHILFKNLLKAIETRS